MTEENLVNEQDKVWVNIERTVNLGNYENVKISLGESKSITKESDPIDVRVEITNQALEDVEEIVKQYKD